LNTFLLPSIYTLGTTSEYDDCIITLIFVLFTLHSTKVISFYSPLTWH